MTNISGNYSANVHKYGENEPKNKISKTESCHCPNCKTENEVNLDKQPNAISGQILVNRAKKPAGEYKFDPKNVENDVYEFQSAYAVVETAENLKNELIKKGYSENKAEEKAFFYAMALLGNKF